jgi:hypothetical protein
VRDGLASSPPNINVKELLVLSLHGCVDTDLSNLVGIDKCKSWYINEKLWFLQIFGRSTLTYKNLLKGFLGDPQRAREFYLTPSEYVHIAIVSILLYPQCIGISY